VEIFSWLKNHYKAILSRVSTVELISMSIFVTNVRKWRASDFYIRRSSCECGSEICWVKVKVKV